MELEVEALFESGDLDLPTGAVTFEAASRTEPGLDGWFLDENGDVVQTMQIKASGNAQIILRHLQEHPDIPDVYTTAEAAEAAASSGIEVVDTGIENQELLELISDELSATGAGDWLLANVPLIVLAIAALSYARNVRRGMDPVEARRLASARIGVALAYSALAWLIATFSGIEAARFMVVLSGEGSRWVVVRLGHELEPSILHVRDLRKVLASLQGDVRCGSTEADRSGSC
jgi:hypothetical protein